MYRRECLLDLLLSDNTLLDPVYGVGGYDDDDISVRAEQAGWRQAVARDTYIHHVGHQSLDRHWQEADRGLSNSPIYIKKWRDYTQRDQSLLLFIGSDGKPLGT